MKNILNMVTDCATRYLTNLNTRDVFPSSESLEGLKKFDMPFPEDSILPEKVLSLLDEVGSPATVGNAGGRFFGFVTGGSLPAALAANWLAGAWDQNAFSGVSSPVGVALEEIAIRWLLDILKLPHECGCSFVTGTSMAHFTALAAARNAVLEKTGWDVKERGLYGAKPVTIVAGAEAHPTLFKAISLLGMGHDQLQIVPVDNQGRMRINAFPKLLDHPTIVCLQAGNVNTGSFDPIEEICALSKEAGAWVHVDGAFGLWVSASPTFSHLTSGIANADSWATDAHKWLNVPYDSGLCFVRNPEYLHSVMSLSAPYIPRQDKREPLHYTPEASRRARGIEVWAALYSLGRSGLLDLIERTCKYASRFAEGLKSEGYAIINDVVINQVLVSFGSEETTRKVIKAIQTDGTCWCGETIWQGQRAMRISVSSWATTEEDVELSLAAMLRIAAEQNRH